jgi:hypothetical protein
MNLASGEAQFREFTGSQSEADLRQQFFGLQDGFDEVI